MSELEKPVVQSVSEPVAVEALKEAIAEERATRHDTPNMEMAPIFEQLNQMLMGAVGQLGAQLQANQAEERARLYERWEAEDRWKAEQEANLHALQERVNELIHSTPEHAKVAAEASLEARRVAAEKAVDPKTLHERLMAQPFVRIYVDDPRIAGEGITLNGKYHWRLVLGFNDVPKDIAENYHTLVRNRALLSELHSAFTANGTGNLGREFPHDKGQSFNRMMEEMLAKHNTRPDNPQSTIDVVSSMPIFRQV
jgi:hypothetical protein